MSRLARLRAYVATANPVACYAAGLALVTLPVAAVLLTPPAWRLLTRLVVATVAAAVNANPFA